MRLIAGWWLFNGLGPSLIGTDSGRVETTSNKPVEINNYDQSKIINDKTAALISSAQLRDITKLLENPVIQDILNNNNRFKFVDASNGEYEKLNKDSILKDLKENILEIQLELQNFEKSSNRELHILAAQLRTENTEKIAQLTYQLNRCCRSSYTQIENHVIKILKDLLGVPAYLTTPQDISKWLRSAFVAKHDLEMQLNNLTQYLRSDYNMLVENNGALIMEKVMDKVLSELNSRITMLSKHEAIGNIKLDTVTDEYIRKIVQDTLEVYDADKTGLVDYALESAGGQVLSTRCTESYHARTAVFSVFGIPLWYLGNTPRTVIMSGVTPGECWAFQNFPGFLVLKLTAPIQIEVFSLEHISKLLVPNGKIDSAPKEFFVFGLRNETDKEPVLLGQYKYDWNGPPLQYFTAQVRGLVFGMIELRIHSNHGNPNYTCLYRFRVHGIFNNEPT